MQHYESISRLFISICAIYSRALLQMPFLRLLLIAIWFVIGSWTCYAQVASRPCTLLSSQQFTDMFQRQQRTARFVLEMRSATETQPGVKILESLDLLGLEIDRFSRFSAPVRLVAFVGPTPSGPWTNICDTAWAHDVEKKALIKLQSPSPGRQFWRLEIYDKGEGGFTGEFPYTVSVSISDLYSPVQRNADYRFQTKT